jgi:hypothetical protein
MASVRALKRILVLAGLVALATAAAAFAKDVTESFRSSVRQVVPAVSGLQIKVVGRDAALELRNDTRRTVIVQGYDREPYLRFSDGSVEENKYSPATYLNRDRAGSQKVPGDANPLARPKWERVASTPVYRWFDHRIHITKPEGTPPQARGKEGPTKISDWNVPLRVDSQRVLVRGSLFWDPESSSDGFPVAIVVAAAGALLLLGLLGFLWRRRRSGPSPPREDKQVKEAW